MGSQETVKYNKLNLGAGSNWRKDGWEVLDHMIVTNPFNLRKQAWELPYHDEQFDIIFCSHVIEHISHFKIEQGISEINRVLKKDGIIRFLTPDLRKIATAYVNNDYDKMDLYIREDDSGIKRTLGLGQAFMNFIVSGGVDNLLLSSDFSTIIAGYAHIFCYDYEMLSGLLKHYGFTNIRQCSINESEIEEHKDLRKGPYDRDAGHSLILECRKKQYIPFQAEKALLYTGPYKINIIIPKPYSMISLGLKALAYLNNTYRYFISKVPLKVRDIIKRRY